MAYYSICPKCQAHLDPNESCDCENEENSNEENSKQAIFSKFIGVNAKTGQLFFQYDNKAEISRKGEQ